MRNVKTLQKVKHIRAVAMAMMKKKTKKLKKGQGVKLDRLREHKLCYRMVYGSPYEAFVCNDL